MRKKLLLVLFLVLLLSLAIVVVVAAQSGDGFDLSWYVLSSGAARSESGDYMLSSTVGQTAAGESTGSDGYTQTHGFWQTFTDVLRTRLPLTVKH